jgi:hypothetical protein
LVSLRVWVYWWKKSSPYPDSGYIRQELRAHNHGLTFDEAVTYFGYEDIRYIGT